MNHKKYILSCAIFCSAFLGLNILSIVNYSIQKKEIIKKTTSFFDSAINELNNIDISNDFDCSYETQNILKEYAISMVYLKEISIIREDIIHCTAYGKSKVKILDSVKSSLNKKPTPSLFIYKSNLTQIGLYQIYIKKQDYTLIGTGNLKKLIDNIKTVNPNYDIEIANSECIDFFFAQKKHLKQIFKIMISLLMNHLII